MPEHAGPIDLTILRDVNLPTPPSLVDLPAPVPDRVPEHVDGSWLAGTLAPVCAWLHRGEIERAADLVQRTATTLRGYPDWTLTTIWLIEVALCWLHAEVRKGEDAGGTASLDGFPRAAPKHGKRQGPALLYRLLADLGDHYCQATLFQPGLELLAQAESWFASSADPAHRREARRAALVATRCRARLQPSAEVEVLLQELCSGPGAADEFTFQAELELLGLQRPTGGEIDTLVDLSSRVAELLERANRANLPECERLRIRALADQLVARSFATSPHHYIRGQARARFETAAATFEQINDPSGRSQVLDGLARVLSQLGEHSLARVAFERSIALKQQLRDLWGLGASLNGLANLLVRAGQPQAALPLYETDVQLLRLIGGMERMIARNLTRHLAALLWTSQNPFTPTRPDPDVLARALRILAEFDGVLEDSANHPERVMLAGAWQRVAALAITSEELAQRMLAEGRELLERSRRGFTEVGDSVGAARATLYLAHLMLDQARLGIQITANRAWARSLLEEAQHRLWDGADRMYLELVWAWWYDGGRLPHLVQRHLAAARRMAELNGSLALALQVDSCLGATILGPSGETDASLVFRPGEQLALEFQAIDWRGLPLSGYTLHASFESSSEEEDEFLSVEPRQAATDHRGRAVFIVRAGPPGQHDLFVGDASAMQGARTRIHVQPCILEGSRPGSASPVPLSDEEQRLLRQLFGPGYSRLRIHREFEGGRSGSRVLLVEPFRSASGSGELRGQACIVKLGWRQTLLDEWDRHGRWVKDILPSNVSRCERFTSWGPRGALRMGLAGSPDSTRVRDACEWLTTASAFDAHLLLERVFVGDLASCWYANAPRQETAQPLAMTYGRIVPPVLTLRDTDPPRGLLPEVPTGSLVRAVEGFLPPEQRPFGPGQEVALHRLTVIGFRRCSRGGWEYELRIAGPPLRVIFQTPLPPEQIDRDGIPEHLLRRPDAWSLRGRVVDTAYDRLDRALRHALDQFQRDHPQERISLSPDGQQLLLQDRALPGPLPALHQLLTRSYPVHQSVIHGDLHGRNVIVGPQAQPFYIDFGKTGLGPTLFDFIKFEVYLWHDNFAGWPGANPPPELNLSTALRLLEDFSSPDPRRRFPSPYALLPTGAGRTDWLTCLVQCLATLRSAARPYILTPDDEDYFAPLCLCATSMLRWCDPAGVPDPIQARERARQGVIHALVASTLLAGALGQTDNR